MRNSASFLSICIPTYNRAALLRECLDSILVSARGYEDQVEIIISDNASTDDTHAVVAEFQRQCPQVCYHRHTANIGAENNFYASAQLAVGEYVWLMGDDDTIVPQAIPTLLARLATGYDLIVSNYSVWSKDWSMVKRQHHLPIKADRVFDNPNELLAHLGIHLGYLSAVVIRRNLLFEAPYAEYAPYTTYGFAFLYAVYAGVATHCHAAYIATPLVRNRAGNSPVTPEIWDRNYLVGSRVVFDALLTKGYTRSAILAAQDRLLKDFVLRTILGRVRDGEETRGLFTLLLPYSKRNWFFWGICVPAMFTPRFLVRLATHWVRRRQGAEESHD
jgi:abequosyltransferase